MADTAACPTDPCTHAPATAAPACASPQGLGPSARHVASSRGLVTWPRHVASSRGVRSSRALPWPRHVVPQYQKLQRQLSEAKRSADGFAMLQQQLIVAKVRGPY
eukprot:1715508-Prymnesium_polylepis.1